MTSVKPKPAAARRDGRSTRFEHRRREILDAVVEYVLERGRADLSLRAVAAAAGVSHATVLHHFKSKDRLVDEVLAVVRARAPRIAPAGDPVVPSPAQLGSVLRATWSYWSAPQRALAHALQYETYATALRDPAKHHDFLQRTVQEWLDHVTAAAIAAGCPQDEARIRATGTVAELRGLLLDLTATQDRQRVDAAVDALITRVQEDAQSWQVH